MKYVRLYSGDDGQSHFEDCAMPLENAEVGQITQMFDVTNAFFGSVKDMGDSPWHNPPARQYVIMLKGGIEIEIGSGEKRVFNEGDILLAEDLTGQGHVTRAANEGYWEYMVVPVSAE